MHGDISHFGSLMTALAATVGTGKYRWCEYSSSFRWTWCYFLDVDYGIGRNGYQIFRKLSSRIKYTEYVNEAWRNLWRTNVLSRIRTKEKMAWRGLFAIPLGPWPLLVLAI